MDLKDILTLLVAAYGAILSTYNLLISHRERSRHIDVTIAMGIDVSTMAGTLILAAINPGSRTVSLTGCGLLLPDGKQFVSMRAWGDQLPSDLDGGHKFTTYYFLKDIASTLTASGYPDQLNIQGFFRDALGKTYKSKPFPCQVRDWIK